MVYFIIFVSLAIAGYIYYLLHITQLRKKEHADLMQKVTKWMEGQARLEESVDKILKVLNIDKTKGREGGG